MRACALLLLCASSGCVCFLLLFSLVRGSGALCVSSACAFSFVRGCGVTYRTFVVDGFCGSGAILCQCCAGALARRVLEAQYRVVRAARRLGREKGAPLRGARLRLALLSFSLRCAVVLGDFLFLCSVSACLSLSLSLLLVFCYLRLWNFPFSSCSLSLLLTVSKQSDRAHATSCRETFVK